MQNGRAPILCFCYCFYIADVSMHGCASKSKSFLLPNIIFKGKEKDWPQDKSQHIYTDPKDEEKPQSRKDGMVFC